ncbi:hypothetical protein TIFTF001_038904 [Ficus carica]|uniref:Uncharacterized protein n=1 Tax=Ficus carica TaxID=3494 RepID=A0AA88E850_FICCA|nr:hypothetical protein TIFTF001_038904 [Ficus carica]
MPNCQPGPNPDADFSEAPMMLSVCTDGTKRDMVVAVQKCGFAWALDRDNGNHTWFTEAGPGVSRPDHPRMTDHANDGRDYTYLT